MTMRPATVEEVVHAVRTHDALTVRAGGTKSAPPAAPAIIELGGLDGVTDYAADECVFSARAGTPVRTIAAMLAAEGQYLPFDPPWLAAGATIGGTVAAGVSGSCRHRYGGVRDFIIGARVVDGEGRSIRSGGRVVKNAAGFLLHHAVVGSRGALGIVTDVTFKVFPSPEARATLQADAGSLAGALDALRAVGAAGIELEAIDFDAGGRLWLRLAGRAAALPARVERLRSALRLEAAVLDDARDQATWEEAREFAWVPADASLVKVPVSPDVVAASGPWPATRFSGGGTVAWMAWTGDVATLDGRLAATGLRGQVVRGPAAGRLVGRVTHNEFEARVQRVLDPQSRFRAASHRHP